MGEYVRTTQERTLDSLYPPLATAIHNHIEKYELGDDIETSVVMCCETVSTKEVKKWFSRKTEVMHTGVILTPQWLIWASTKDDKSLGVLSARLRDIRVQDYENTKMYEMIQDTGLNIDGLRTADGPGSAFIGLGPEPAAQKFRALLQDAIAKV